MALMSSNDRAALRSEWFRELSRLFETLDVTKAEARSALDAADQWADDNSGAYNTALPEPFRSTATAKQKAKLLSLVIAKRHDLDL